MEMKYIDDVSEYHIYKNKDGTFNMRIKSDSVDFFFPRMGIKWASFGTIFFPGKIEVMNRNKPHKIRGTVDITGEYKREASD